MPLYSVFHIKYINSCAESKHREICKENKRIKKEKKRRNGENEKEIRWVNEWAISMMDEGHIYWNTHFRIN